MSGSRTPLVRGDYALLSRIDAGGNLLLDKKGTVKILDMGLALNPAGVPPVASPGKKK